MRSLLATLCLGALMTGIVTIGSADPAAACSVSTSATTSRNGTGSTAQSVYVSTCDGRELTGLTHEELWAQHCLGDWEPGDTVTFRFEAISSARLEHIAEIAFLYESDDHFTVMTPYPDFEPTNPWLPDAGIDITQVYTEVTIRCQNAAGGSISWVVIRRVAEFVDPIVLRNAAEAQINLPEPAVGSNPPFDEPGRFGVVHIPTWLWINDPWEQDGPYEEIDGPAAVAVAAFPNYVAWDPGDGGDVQVCPGPGVPWAPGMDEDDTYCSYTYERSSAGNGSGDAYDMSATVNWTLVWWVNGAYLGPYDSIDVTTNFTYQVGEIQAIETSTDS